jgi:dCTP deaminase
VIADGNRRFDMIGAGYHGPLYAEISPKTFPVLLREGSRLSQVRFRAGDAVLGAEELDALHANERLVDVADADCADEGILGKDETRIRHRRDHAVGQNAVGVGRKRE